MKNISRPLVVTAAIIMLASLGLAACSTQGGYSGQSNRGGQSDGHSGHSH